MEWRWKRLWPRAMEVEMGMDYFRGSPDAFPLSTEESIATSGRGTNTFELRRCFLLNSDVFIELMVSQHEARDNKVN